PTQLSEAFPILSFAKGRFYVAHYFVIPSN
ncbi:MAG: hypothetical protein ACI90V_012502, partial [Bacillariaceae sp.]